MRRSSTFAYVPRTTPADRIEQGFTQFVTRVTALLDRPVAPRELWSVRTAFLGTGSPLICAEDLRRLPEKRKPEH